MQKPKTGSDSPAESSADDYFLEIESRFAELRETPFVFSSKDWALMKSWRDAEIPLAIVVEAIDQCFTKRRESKRRGTISSLSYCRHAVEELWEERKDLYTGRESGEQTPDTPQQQLAALAAEIRCAADAVAAPVAERLREVAGQVVDLHAGRTVAEIEAELMEMEQRLLEELEALIPVEDRNRMEEELRDALASLGTSDAEVVEKSRRAIRKKIVRKRLAVPRLSLFS